MSQMEACLLLVSTSYLYAFPPHLRLPLLLVLPIQSVSWHCCGAVWLQEHQMWWGRPDLIRIFSLVARLTQLLFLCFFSRPPLLLLPRLLWVALASLTLLNLIVLLLPAPCFQPLLKPALINLRIGVAICSCCCCTSLCPLTLFLSHYAKTKHIWFFYQRNQYYTFLSVFLLSQGFCFRAAAIGASLIYLAYSTSTSVVVVWSAATFWRGDICDQGVLVLVSSFGWQLFASTNPPSPYLISESFYAFLDGQHPEKIHCHFRIFLATLVALHFTPVSE